MRSAMHLTGKRAMRLLQTPNHIGIKQDTQMSKEQIYAWWTRRVRPPWSSSVSLSGPMPNFRVMNGHYWYWKRIPNGKSGKPSLQFVERTYDSHHQKRYSKYGEHVSDQVRMLHQDQAMHCQRIINDAIFKAKRGTLSKYAEITLPS